MPLIDVCDTELPLLSPKEAAGQSPAGEVHIWKYELQPGHTYDHHILHLSSEEKKLADSIEQASKRKSYITARALLRILLGQYTGQQARAITIGRSAYNKPVAEGRQGGNLHFNVSHSGNGIVIAFATTPVGIDLEQPADSFDYHQMLPDYFSPEEARAILGSPKPAELFYRYWTRKECLAKATGKGVDGELRLLPCLDGLHQVARAVTGSDQDWKIRSLDTDGNGILSVAYSTQVAQIRLIDAAPLLQQPAES